MKIETIQKRKTESLLTYIEKLDERYYNAVMRPTGIDFGYGMRAYSRLKHQAFPDDKMRTTFKNIVEELKERNFDINEINVTYLKPYLT